MVKAPIFQGAIKLRNVLDCQAKILEAVMDRRQCGAVDIIFIMFRLFHCYVVVFWATSLVLPRVSKRLTMGRSAEGEIKHAWRLVFLRRVRPHASIALAELVQH